MRTYCDLNDLCVGHGTHLKSPGDVANSSDYKSWQHWHGCQKTTDAWRGGSDGSLSRCLDWLGPCSWMCFIRGSLNSLITTLLRVPIFQWSISWITLCCTAIELPVNLLCSPLNIKKYYVAR